jgi:hypothetical protein
VALSVWRRSSLPLLAAEQGTQGGEDLGWQGGDALLKVLGQLIPSGTPA